ncbi:MAG: hypothetical protein WHT06_02630 [Desulfobacterales bacterium]
MAVFVALTLAYLAGTLLVGRPRGDAPALVHEEYPSCLAFSRQCSVYDVFRHAAADWRFSAAKVEADFQHYLRSGETPPYVLRYARREVRPEEIRLYLLFARRW